MTCFSNVLKGVTEIGFVTCAALLDGNRINMKFYRENLCGGKLMMYVDNPFMAGYPIFPLFDTVHIFKCFYNIFLTRNELKIPAFGDFKAINPMFEHIKEVYGMEMGKPVKYGYKLNDKNLASKPIERCNVQLADAIFHESTINALTVYANIFPEFLDTAEYLRRIRKWWNIVNVNSLTMGKRKRDVDRNAVTREDRHVCEYMNNDV